ncbi:hypothetical protein [Clostridium tagluense]|uniref:hypothetical protein n=1 Tax=Clostridium tagluense TaxID=360422 RepID=UPI001C0AEC0B|nr:hypothetical protein [Clostridium tagluense]MBU3130206.1 hypothetical protein [Clostridium tagluense]
MGIAIVSVIIIISILEIQRCFRMLNRSVENLSTRVEMPLFYFFVIAPQTIVYGTLNFK